MRMKIALCSVASFAVFAIFCNPSFGQLYSQNFDVDDTANWTVNLSPTTDSNADLFFDYSTVGIPSAPNSTGGTTRGMKLQANLFTNLFGGMSASPTGQSFTGDYVLSYDMWQSYHGVPFVPPAGIFPAGGGIIRGQASGGTNLGYGGIMTSGTVANSAGTADGVFFASTTDGDSGADYRVYSSDKNVSYQPNALPPTDPGFDARDLDANYLAVGGSAPADFDGDLDVDGFDFLQWQRGNGNFVGTAVKANGDANADGFVDALDLEAWEYWKTVDHKTRNAATSTLYTDNFGGAFPTAAQTALFPSELAAHPDNKTDVGVQGYAWHEHTITKSGNIVTWSIDGIDLIVLDTSNFTIPVGGSNILFGHGDINNGSSIDAQAFTLLFTLVDNVQVNALPVLTSSVPEPSSCLILAAGLACLVGCRSRTKDC